MLDAEKQTALNLFLGVGESDCAQVFVFGGYTSKYVEIERVKLGKIYQPVAWMRNKNYSRVYESLVDDQLERM